MYNICKETLPTSERHSFLLESRLLTRSKIYESRIKKRHAVGLLLQYEPHIMLVGTQGW